MLNTEYNAHQQHLVYQCNEKPSEQSKEQNCASPGVVINGIGHENGETTENRQHLSFGQGSAGYFKTPCQRVPTFQNCKLTLRSKTVVFFCLLSAAEIAEAYVPRHLHRPRRPSLVPGASRGALAALFSHSGHDPQVSHLRPGQTTRVAAPPLQKMA